MAASVSTTTTSLLLHLLRPPPPPSPPYSLLSSVIRPLRAAAPKSRVLLLHAPLHLNALSSSSSSSRPFLHRHRRFFTSHSSLPHAPQSVNHLSAPEDDEFEEFEEDSEDEDEEIGEFSEDEDEDDEIEEYSEDEDVEVEIGIGIGNGELGEIVAKSSESVGVGAEAMMRSRRDNGTEKISMTVKEKKELASYANSLGKKLKSQLVGKGGVTANVAASFVETLESNEILKIKIHRSCPGEIDEVVTQLQELTASVVVSKIGRTIILYRPSLTKMKEEEKKRQAQKLHAKRMSRTRVKPTFLKEGKEYKPSYRGRNSEGDGESRPSYRGRSSEGDRESRPSYRGGRNSSQGKKEYRPSNRGRRGSSRV